MPMSWEEYDRMQEAAAIGDYLGHIEAAIKKRSEGRNLGGQLLYSFGTNVHTSIRRITGANDDSITVAVDGHHSVSTPDNRALADIAYELVCGFVWPREWDGDGSWDFYFSEEVTVATPWDDDKTDEANFEAMAQLIIEQARMTCAFFEGDMMDLEEQLRDLEEEAGRPKDPKTGEQRNIL